MPSPRVGHTFKTLSTALQDAWDTAGRRYQTRSRLGQSGPMTGYQLYAKINCTLKACGQDTVDTPPGPPNLPAVAPTALVITNTLGVVAVKLTCPTNPGETTFIRASAPVSSAVRSLPQTRLLGMCPAPAGWRGGHHRPVHGQVRHPLRRRPCIRRGEHDGRGLGRPAHGLHRAGSCRGIASQDPHASSILLGACGSHLQQNSPFPKMKISPPNTPDDRKKLEAELTAQAQQIMLTLSVLSFIVVATVGLLALCSCAHTEKGLQRENYLHDAASNAITTLQPVVQAAPAPANAILGSVFAGLSGLLALWATHIQRSVKDLQKGNGGGNSDPPAPSV